MCRGWRPARVQSARLRASPSAPRQEAPGLLPSERMGPTTACSGSPVRRRLVADGDQLASRALGRAPGASGVRADVPIGCRSKSQCGVRMPQPPPRRIFELLGCRLEERGEVVSGRAWRPARFRGDNSSTSPPVSRLEALVLAPALRCLTRRRRGFYRGSFKAPRPPTWRAQRGNIESQFVAVVP